MNALTDPYRVFLEAKVRLAPAIGFDVAPEEINPILLPHQRAIVRWAVRGGRRAIFCAFGLGKTFMQIEVSRIALGRILRESGRQARALIVLPLGVRQEFKRDAHVLSTGEHPRITDERRAELAAWLDGHPERAPSVRFIRRNEDVDGPGVYLTNYESVRDGKLDPALFDVASLDEASVLRSFGSKTFQTFLSLFANVRFRFVATATPSPNRTKELIHYAGFLGVMDTGQALTRFFQRDSSEAGNLTLYPHKEREFWLWVNSWACFVQRPSDLGFSDEGYALPEMIVRWHEVQTNLADAGENRDGQGILFRDGARGLMQEAKERRDTLPARIDRMASIIAEDPDAHRLLWHDLEDERRAIEKAVPGVRSVFGSQDLDAREQTIIDFSDGKFRHLAAKPVIAGSGCNFQRYCHKAVFVGVSHKFNDFIQAIHRIQRFLQLNTVEIDIIHAESEREVVRDLQAKWADHDRLVSTMSDIIREYGLNPLNLSAELTRAIGVERIEAHGDGWQVANNDCVAETRSMADNSVDLIVTSIPFSNHYEYTPSYNDFGHTDDDEHFFGQMDYLTPELIRILKPGRLACIHVKDRILFGNVTGLGFPTVNPFHAKCIGHYAKHGLAYLGLIYIDTDVVRENNQTYRLGYSEMRKDGTKMGVGSPEFVLLFRKVQTDRSKGYADDPVQKRIVDYSLARWQLDAHARWRSSGNRLMTPEELMAIDPNLLPKVFREASAGRVYDFETHVRIGEALAERQRLPSIYMALHPGTNRDDVWADVNRMLTLNTTQAAKGREQHVCPLQFDIVDRLIERWSEPGELVFDPFGGLFTVPMRAIRLRRCGRSVELNSGYFLDGVKVLEATERSISIPDLFDVLNDAEAA
ncbi:DNA methyltransferase [Bosea sp. 2KB_26]|uniref:DNA methyltransferase n=1 Tax=Bosea sp. 2KB_26 TaxID=3237475 RepID=UPI003F8F26BA